MFTLGLAILAMAFIYVPPLSGTIARQALGIVVVLFLPGYAVVSALFPGQGDIGGIERAVLSFAMSIAALPLAGLVLNYTPWGIRLDPLVVCVGILTVTGVLIASKRRLDIPAEGRFSPDLRGFYRSLSSDVFGDKTGFDKAMTVLLIIAIIIAIYTIFYFLSMPRPGEMYTEFYILGPDGKANNYPYNFVSGDNKTVIVGIANHELRNVTYDLAVGLDGVNNSTAEGLYSEHFTVSDQGVLEKAVDLTPTMPGSRLKMEFRQFERPV